MYGRFYHHSDYECLYIYQKEKKKNRQSIIKSFLDTEGPLHYFIFIALNKSTLKHSPYFFVLSFKINFNEKAFKLFIFEWNHITWAVY